MGVPSIKSRLTLGATFMVGLQFFQRFLGIISLAILARLLTPDDFGVVTVVMGLYAILSDSTRMNFGAKIIQMPEHSDSHINTAWTLNMLRGLVIFLLIMFLSIFPSFYPKIAELQPAMMLVAFLPLVESMFNGGMIVYEKEINYRPKFISATITKLVAFTVTVVLAWWLRSYWAMLIGLLSGSICSVASSYILSRYRPRFCLHEWRSLFSFTGWLMGVNVCNAISGRIAVFLIAGNLSLAKAGIFNMAVELGRLVESHITFPLLGVLYTGLSKSNQEVEKLRENYLRARNLLVSLLLPLGLGVAVTGRELVAILLGDGWEQVPPVLAIFSVSSSLALYCLGTDQVMLALARTRTLFNRQLFGSCLIVITTTIGLLGWGLWGMLFLNLAASLTIATINLNLLIRNLETNGRAMAKGMLAPLLAGLCMVLAVQNIEYLQLPVAGVWFSLLCKAVLGAAVYIAVHVIIWLLSGRPESVETELAAIVRGYIAKHRNGEHR